MPQANQPSEFLWINKDTESLILPRDKRGTATAINRHVQLASARAYNLERTKSLQGSRVFARKTAEQVLRFRLTKAHDVDKEIVSTKRSKHKTSKQEALDSAPKKTSQTPTAPQAEHTSVNPFNSAEIVYNEKVHSLLRYHLSYSIATIFRNGLLTGVQTPERLRYGQHLQDVVRGCSSGEMHMYALLSATAGRMTMVSKSHENHANYFMQNATRLMREHFLTPNPTIDSQIIRNMSHLCVSEWYRGNHDSALIHLRIFGKLADVLDMAKSGDMYLYDNACCFDVYIAIETGAPPIFPLSWQPGKVSSNQMSEINHDLDQLLSRPQQKPLWDPFRPTTTEERLLGATIGPFIFPSRRPTDEDLCAGKNGWGSAQRPGKGFADALVEGLFDPPMNGLVSDLIGHLEISAYSSICSDLGRPGVTLMGKRTTALLHQLVSTVTSKPIDECFRLATIVMMSYVSNPMAWRSNVLVASRLKKAVLAMERDFHELRSQISAQLMLWVLVVGSFAAQDTPECTWFLGKAHRLASSLGLETYVELRDTIAKFVHFETAQHECLRRLASRLAESESNHRV